ncbi:hypothetical protein LTR56_009310 [Elasticomyces elasticus]|nr:hypothetical protein LTR56_009310 [Elasticomyces elasticus]KAK3666376.1 hypothetical protein LTR22_002680 [Elasticomyces elasticus]KAK4917755.1 hypothetical protein LTR49_014432 [Elasticomyces elasticus]KAK5766316.1 hypothetical protein LTS12_003527 [Elasticomyces elasticus]
MSPVKRDPYDRTIDGLEGQAIELKVIAQGASGDQQAAHDLEADILAYITKYNAYIDKKIEAAESGDAAAFFDDNPGLQRRTRRPPER